MKSRSGLLVATLLLVALVVSAPAAVRLVARISTDTSGVAADRIVSSLTARLRDVSSTPAVSAGIPGSGGVKGVSLSRGGDYPNGAFAISLSPAVEGMQAFKVAQALKATGLYEFVDVMYPLQSQVMPEVLTRSQSCAVATGDTPNDSCLPYQWYLDKIGAKTLWGTAADDPTNAALVRVAVIDSGSTAHPDSGSTVAGQDLIGASKVRHVFFIDDVNVDGFTSAGDGDGYDTDPTDLGDGRDANTCHTSSLTSFSPVTWAWAAARDTKWHGTAVSGLINAKRNNSVGVAGIAPNVKVEHVRVLGKCTETDDPYNLVNGIYWAAGVAVTGTATNSFPADIINMSLGSQQPYNDYCPTVYQEAIDAARTNGIVVVASSGNDGNDVDARRNTPSNCNGVISVGSTNRTDTLSSFSTTGADMVAPGGTNNGTPDDDIIVTKNSGQYTYDAGGNTFILGAGTSYSAPMVSAALAMVMTKYGKATFTNVKLETALLYAASLGTQCTGCGAGMLDIPTLINVLATDATPSPARNIGIAGWGPNTVTVSWDAPLSNLWNTVDSYVVKAYAGAVGGSPVGTCSPDSLASLACRIGSLTQNTTYYFTVDSTNEGNTSTAARVAGTTYRQATAPQNVTATPGSTTINVRWDAPADMGDDNAVLDEARAYAAASGGDPVTQCYSSERTCILEALQPSTDYWLSVAVMTGSGYSQWSSRTKVTTAAVPVVVTTTTAAPSQQSPQTTVAPTATTSPSSGGTSSGSTSSGGSSSPATKVGKTTSGSSLAKSAGVSVPSGAKVSVKVASSSSKYCKVSGTSVKALKAGTCKVTVTVTPKKGKAVTKTVALTVSK